MIDKVLSSFFSFLIVISIIVFVHEMGHYLAARAFGVSVVEFSIGFGKALFNFKDKHGTLWKIAPIPLGGYVKMLGDRGAGSDSDFDMLKALPKDVQRKTFSMQSPFKRAFIAFAGPLANYILAISILSAIYFAYGKIYISSEISEVVEESVAFKAGILKGDKILSINSNEIQSFDDVVNYVSIRPNHFMKIKIQRNDAILEVSLISGSREVRDDRGKLMAEVGSLGIKSSIPVLEKQSFISSVTSAGKEALEISFMTFEVLRQMIFGSRSVNELRGVITMAEQSGISFENGYINFAIYVAMISINIGFVNLLPIPLLDGGHIMFCAYEIIARKRPSKNIQSILTTIGVIIIIFMFVISTSNDIKALLF